MPRSSVSTQDFTALSSGNLSSVDSTNWLELDGVDGFVSVAASAPLGLTNSFIALSACRHKGTYDADQYAEVTLTGTLSGNTDGAGVILRASTDSGDNSDGYVIYLRVGTGVVVARRTNDAEAALSTGTSPITGITWGAGDKLSAEVTGTGATVTIEVFRTPSGGSLTSIGTFTDTAAGRFTSGNPGVVRGQSGNTRITNWEAGNVTAGSGPTGAQRSRMLLGIG